MKTALFPGSFDPVTLGHVDLIGRARRLCDRLIVAVMVNPDKRGSFSAEERVAMLGKALSGMEGVEVTAFSGLTVDLAREVGAGLLVRGVRDGQDLAAETALAWGNEALMRGLETAVLITRPELSYISSSLVRQAARFGADISAFVPGCLVDEITRRLYNENKPQN